MTLTKDIKMARNIIDGKYSPCDNEEYSEVYLYSNEYLSHYAHLFEGIKTMLGVIGSGEQIFSAVLSGVEKIDAFDISKFAKLFFCLKKAAIESLSLEEYVMLFHPPHVGPELSTDTRLFQQLYQDKISEKLTPDDLVFWNYLFDNYSWWEILSRLCRVHWANDIRKDIQLKNNKFLDPKYYQELRARLKDTEISCRVGNITSLVSKYKAEYDLIYLSNVICYIEKDKFLSLLGRLKTTMDGLLLLTMVINFDILENRVGNFDFRKYSGSPYIFTREDGYIIGKKRG